MFAKPLLFASGDKFVEVPLEANDNELVFQVYQSGQDKNYFKSANLTRFPVSAYSVYINGELTEQEYNSLTFARGDVVKIVAESVNGFPILEENASVGCIYSVAKFPKFLDKNGNAATDFSNMFSGNSNLGGCLYKIPTGLLENNTSCKDLTWAFAASKVKDVPADIFSYCPNLIDVDGCFISANLETIPEDIYAYNPKLQNVSRCFDLGKLTEIPSGLFANNPQLKDVGSFFDEARITSIPSGLFANNPNIEETCGAQTALNHNGSQIWVYRGLFYSCTELSSVPQGLFATNTKIKSFNGLFANCTSLTSIPENLFETNTSVEKFSCTFFNCDKLSCRVKIGSTKVSDVTHFCLNAGQITVVVPAGSTTETTFRSYAATVNNLTVETF